MNQMLEELDEYADSIDNDMNTIQNLDTIDVADTAEYETLRNVFNFLDNFIKKHNKEPQEINHDKKK